MPSADLSSLSLRELHARLQARGVDLSYSALSEFVQTGDIAEQLHVGGKGNRKAFLPETVETLAEFLPAFRQVGGKWPHAPAMLRNWLASSAVTKSTELIPLSTSSEVPQSRELAAIAGREQGLSLGDEVYTAQEAAAFLRCSVGTLKRRVPCSFRLGRSPRWYKSDLLRLGKINS